MPEAPKVNSSNEWDRHAEVQAAVGRTDCLTRFCKLDSRRLFSVSDLAENRIFRIELSWSLDGKPELLNATFGGLGMPGTLVSKRGYFPQQPMTYTPATGREKVADEMFIPLSHTSPSIRTVEGGEGRGDSRTFHIFFTSPKVNRSTPFLKLSPTLNMTVVSSSTSA